jgi:hypothetical protein
MKTYKNEQCGFEVDIPEGWSFHSDEAIHYLLGKDHFLIL